MRLTVLALLCLGILATEAAAQGDGAWVVVTSQVGKEVPAVGATARELRKELLRRGFQVWPDDEAAATFDARESAPPRAIDERKRRRWISLSDAAVDDLAEASFSSAIEKLEAAQEISREAVEELNRDPESSRRMLDTCLYRVRALLATRSESRASAAARECRELVPRGTPSQYMHPPAVTKLLDEVDAVRVKQTGELTVQSEPPGCAARLNGLLLGETPVSIGELFPSSYRVQVECGPERRGRIHVVAVGAGAAQVRIDGRFDEVVATRPTMSLGYSGVADERRHSVPDASRIAQTIGAAGAILVSASEARTVELTRIDVDEGGSPVQAAFARLSATAAGLDATLLRSAAATLDQRRCMDFTSPEPVALPCPGTEAATPMPLASEPQPSRRQPRGRLIAGLTIAGVGVAGLTAGYVLLAPRSNAALDWVRQVDAGGQDTSAQQKWFDLRGAIIASGSVGSAALVTAMPLALPKAQKTPWWAWVSGGVGIGLAAFSVAWGVTADAGPSQSCSSSTLDSVEVRSCVNRGEQTSVALLTGLTSAPLITMPLVYLLRPSRARLEPEVKLGRGGGYVALRGRF
jgi:hypothetical protein